MKLKTQLRESPLERLQAIACFWELKPADESVAGERDALAEHLYPRMQTGANFRVAFDKLDGRERDWVYLLALHGGELPVEEFRKRARLSEAQTFADALALLGERGFLWRERVRDTLISIDLIGIPEPFVRLVELPPYWQGFVGFYLQGLGTDELKTIARNTLDERLSSRRKQALVHYIRRGMLDPKTLRAALSRRDAIQLEMFQQILQKNGVCAWKDLLDTGVHKKFDHVRADHLRDLVERSGLVFVLRPSTNKYNNLLMAPRDVAWVIQNDYRRDERTLEELSHGGPEHRGTPAAGEEPTHRPGVILDNSNNILRDLVIMCSYIQRNPVKMLNNGGLSRNDLKKVAPLLSHNKTTKYVSFLALFAMVRKLIIPVGDQWRVSGSLPQWLAKGQGCYHDLYEFWLSTNEWNEEYLDGDVLHADSYPQNLISITELRKLILRMLEKIPPDTWIDFETFADSLLPQVAIEIPGRFDLTPADKFNRHPILIMEAIIAETLYWLGLVVLGVADLEAARQLGSRPNESIAPYDPTHPLSVRLIGEEHFLFSFRMSDCGRKLLERPFLEPEKLFAHTPDAELPYATLSDDFTVQPNLEIVTPPDLRLDKLFRLLGFTDIRKVDIMTTMTISHDSVRAGLDHGQGAESMLALLEECSRKELPETVRQMIGECESRHGEVDLGLCSGYLDVSDRLRLEELKANPKIAPSIKEVFADRLILLSRTADLKKIARELRRLGYMPHIDSDSVYVTSEGLFQITLRGEELYDLLAVLRFATIVEEENGSTIFEDRVTPLIERLSAGAQENFNPRFYSESIARTFYANYERQSKKQIEEETRKYRKQISRLVGKSPRTREPARFKGDNPASDPAEVQRMIKFAIEHEMPVKIHYERNSGEALHEAIEPEAIQGKKVYAFCPASDEHRFFALERIRNAAI